MSISLNHDAEGIPLGGGDSTQFSVRVELFSGPLDLLLHLVKLNELPIEKLSLSLVASQYVACLQEFGVGDVEVAGEYLVIAATLLAVKSSMLVEGRKNLEDIASVSDVVEEEPPHEELLRRLREIEAYRHTATDLSMKSYFEIDVFGAGGQESAAVVGEPPLARHDPFRLGVLFQKVLKKYADSQTRLEISVEGYAVSELMSTLEELVRLSGEEIYFRAFIERELPRVPKDQIVTFIVTSFLSLLELCRLRKISLFQNECFDDVILSPYQVTVRAEAAV
jgi:segregation and condensation protein A